MRKTTVPDYPVMYKIHIVANGNQLFRYDDFLFVYVCSGTGSLNINGIDYPMEKNGCRVIARGEQASFSTDRDMQVICIRISGDAVVDFLLHTPVPDLIASDSPMDSSIPLPNHLLLQSLISGIEAGITNDYRANTPLTCLKVQECLNMLVFVCPELHRWLYKKNSLCKICLRDFMEAHYRENLPFGQFALATGRSLSTFRRDFLREFKMTPGQWILQRRLQEAYRLISQKGQKPSACFLELGFESFSHFSRTFKAYFGVQPSALLHT